MNKGHSETFFSFRMEESNVDSWNKRTQILHWQIKNLCYLTIIKNERREESIFSVRLLDRKHIVDVQSGFGPERHVVVSVNSQKLQLT